MNYLAELMPFLRTVHLLTSQDLELAQTATTAQGSSLKEARENLEREMIQQSLKRHAWKITAAANELGVSRPTFYELMEKLGIQKPEAEKE